MTQALTLILVDDDEDFLYSLQDLLEFDGHTVYPFKSLSEMSEKLGDIKPDILILDVNFPKENALHILPSLREETNCGLVLISGSSEYEIRINGLELGADAYLSKPVEYRELRATLMALYKRLQPSPSKSWLLDAGHWKLTSPKNTEYKLTENEFIFLNILVSAQGDPVSKQEILEELCKDGSLDDEANLHVLVSRLRKKINHVEGEELPVRARRNVGYVFYEDAKIT